MKIISWNANGIRSLYKKGFLDWFSKANADIVCLQELKAKVEDLPQGIREIKGYHSYFNVADKKGYSGVAVYTKEKPSRVSRTNGIERFDSEGRVLELEFKDFTLLNLYIPHGGRQKENLEYKLEVYKELLDYLRQNKDKNLILIGDFNIAHTELDLARPKNNKKNIMFTPEERAQIEEIINLGFIDTFRMFDKNGGNYTWWPWLANARERNIGWRIDYCFVSGPLKDRLIGAEILKEVYGSDHCPVGIELSN